MPHVTDDVHQDPFINAQEANVEYLFLFKDRLLVMRVALYVVLQCVYFKFEHLEVRVAHQCLSL